jgi:hypothetical protein
MYWGDSASERDALASPFDQPSETRVGFSEAYELSTTYGHAAKQFLSRDLERHQQWEQMLGEVRERTGRVIPHPMAGGKGDIGQAVRKRALSDLEKLRAERPDLNLPEKPEDEIERRTDDALRGVVAGVRAADERPRTWGGFAGSLLGEMAVMATDPVQLPLLITGAGSRVRVGGSRDRGS